MRPVPALLLVVALVPAAAGASPRWTAPVPLSAEARALGPDLAVGASGHALAVWDREEGAECATSPASLGCVHIVTARSRAAASWGPEVEVNRPGVGAEPRAAVDDAGAEALIWIHDIGENRVVQATYRPSSGVPFPEPNDLSKIVSRASDHQIALDRDGDALAIWRERRLDGSSAVVAATRPANTGVWSGPATLSTPGTAIRAGPRVAVTAAGSAYAVWNENGVVRAAQGWAWGMTGAWAPAETISPPGGDAAGDVDVAVGPTNEPVAAWLWQGLPRGTFRVQVAKQPAGYRWSAPQDLGEVGAVDMTDVEVGVDGRGSVVALWVDGSRTARLSATPTSPRAVQLATRAADPQLVVDPTGNAVAVWRDASTSAIKASVRPPAAGAWQPPVTLAGGGASAPRVGIDASGAATAVWNRATSGAVAVEASDLTGIAELSLALVRRPAVRGVARAGRAVTCDGGAWEGTIPIRYAYAWLRNSRAVKAAARSRYVVRRADAGTRLACRVTATNVARSLSATSRPVWVRR